MILGVIYCTGSSKNAREKSMQLLNGKPLLSYTLQAANQCNILDDVIVSTESEYIAEVAIQNRAKVPFLLPSQLITPQTSKWSVLLHVVEKYEKEFGKEVSHVVDMGITVPLKTAADIDGAVNLALQHLETDVVITGYPSRENPYFNMVELTKKGYAEIVSRDEEPILRLQDAPAVFSISDAAFVIKKSALYNYSHWSQAVCRVYEIPRERALTTDNGMDAELIKLLLNRYPSI